MPLVAASTVNQYSGFQLQADATLTEVDPVKDTVYTVLDTTDNVRLLFITLNVAAFDETLHCQITIDGEVFTGSVAATAGVTYYVRKATNTATLGLSSTLYTTAIYNCLEGRSVKVEVWKSTEAGSGTLTARVVYMTQ